MVGPKVYHIKNTRNYTGTTAVPVNIIKQLNDWFDHKEFHVKRINEQFSRGHKKGLHVNFVPKYKLHVYAGLSGSVNVAIEYYAKIKIGTAVVVGVLTSGISTVVGVGTLAYTLSEADEFVSDFWRYVDSLAHSNYVVVGIERWKSDGKGGMVLTTDPVKYAPPTYAQPPPQHQPPTYAQPPPQHYQPPPQHYQPPPQHYQPAPQPYPQHQPPPQQYQPQPTYSSPVPQHYQQYPANQQLHYSGGHPGPYAPQPQYQPQPYSEQGPPLPPKPAKKTLSESLELDGGPHSPHPTHQQQMYYPPPTPAPHPPYAPSSTANANVNAQAGINHSGGLYPAIQPQQQQQQNPYPYQPNNQYK